MCTHLAELVDSTAEFPETAVHQMNVERILMKKKKWREIGQRWRERINSLHSAPSGTVELA